MPSAWRRMVAEAIARDPRCAYCGEGPRADDELVGDHLVPKARGGRSVASNLVVAHRSCNRRKWDR